MSGAEFLAVLGGISSVIAIIDGTKKAFDAVKDQQGLPEAFRDVAGRLPLVRDILGSAKEHIEKRKVEESSYSGARDVVNLCQSKAEKLDELFQKICPADGASRLEKYYKAVKALGKGHKVEDLMEGVLKDVQLLACESGMKTADEKQEEEIIKAITEVSAISPSVPEHVFQEGGLTAYHSGSGTQYNATGGYIAQGDARQYNSAGGPMNFGTIINHDYSQPDSPPFREEEKCHIRMLYSNYEEAKDLNPEPSAQTCGWFLNHVKFLSWRNSQSSVLLWLSADPGCGKSVLAKHLVDRRTKVLSVKSKPPTVCYYFFRGEGNDRSDGAKAMCAILHQLLLEQPHLYLYAKKDFVNKNEKFLTDFYALWNIFVKAAKDPSQHEIIIILDALDECEERSRKLLVAGLVQLYGNQSLDQSEKPLIKFLVTSRPKYEIVKGFKRVAQVRLRGEEESEQISHEIDLVINAKVEELAWRMDLSPSITSHLRCVLSNANNRTYLWLHLTINVIEQKLWLSKDDVAAITKIIPSNIEQAYTAILNQSPDLEKARRLLHLVLGAVRPLTLLEANVAMVMDKPLDSSEDLDIWPAEVRADRIKNTCGLFVTVVNSRIYLIHQTAREFLIGNEYGAWKKSFCPMQSHLLLANVCIWYLQLRKFEKYEAASSNQILQDLDLRLGPQNNKGPKSHRDLAVPIEYTSLANSQDFRGFLLYAAPYWEIHFTQAESLMERSTTEAVANRICNTLSRSVAVWSLVHEHFAYPKFNFPDFRLQSASNLHIASFFGLTSAVKLLLERDHVRINSKDNLGRTPLSLAALEGHGAVVKLLVEQEEILVDSRDRNLCTPLILAASKGHEAVVVLLLERGNVDINARDEWRRTPLISAIMSGHEALAKPFFEHREMEVDLLDNAGADGGTALSDAAFQGHSMVVKALLERGGSTNLGNENAGSPLWYAAIPLWYAATRGLEKVVELLLKHGAEVNTKETLRKETPLHCAAYLGYTAVVVLLLKNGARADSENANGETPLHGAASEGFREIVQLLCACSAQVDSTDNSGATPLHRAASGGHEAVAGLLLKYGANVNLSDNKGVAPLHEAALHLRNRTVKLLLKHGAQADLKDKEGETALHKIAPHRIEMPNRQSRPMYDRYGCYSGSKPPERIIRSEPVATVLGTQVDHRSKTAQTELMKVLTARNVTIVNLLLSHGAQADAENHSGQTALSLAKTYGLKEVSKLLEEHLTVAGISKKGM